ncbi:MAG: type II secretion system secretin GspD [Pseudomonadales bacterium]|nr:type II secretion system secretin GspD [Pseudomonadales bacterium]
MNRTSQFLPFVLIVCLACAAPDLRAEDAASNYRINLKDADMGEFITQVARITGRNFVVDPRVKGRITVISSASLDEEGVYELFLSVLRVHGFAAVPTGEVVKIVQQTLAKQSANTADFDPNIEGEEMITRVIPATNVQSSELVKILRPLIPQYSHVASVDNPNVVILSDHAENIRRMEAIIREIDVADDEQVVVVPLEEAYVDNMVSLLEQLAPEQIGGQANGPQAVQVVANARNNSLVLRGKAMPVERLRGLIRTLDTPASNTGATRVFRLRHSDAEQVATILEGILTQQTPDGEGPVQTTIRPDTSLNAIVVRADPTTMIEVAAIVDQLDVRRTQVLIEAAIVEVSLSDNTALGVDFALADRGGQTVPLVSSPLGGTLAAVLGSLTGGDGDAPITTEDLSTADLLNVAGAVNSPTVAVARLTNGVSFAAIIQALETNSDSNLLSTPSILTLDNEEASIIVGQNVPFRTGSFTTNQNGANNPFTTIQREDVGITLKVTPHIHDGDAVRLEVNQEVSSVVNQAVVSNAGFSDIVTSKRNIETTILADDGQTIVLGGLIEDNITEIDSRVPFFGSIPVAGRLFRNTTTDRQRRNLLVFLRPTVLRDEADVENITQRKYDGVWEVGGPGNLPPGVDRDEPPPEIDALYRGRRNGGG